MTPSNPPPGPQASTVVTGLVCAAVVGLALWAQTHDGQLPTRHTLLISIGVLGVLMLGAAVVGLLTHRGGSDS